MHRLESFTSHHPINSHFWNDIRGAVADTSSSSHLDIDETVQAIRSVGNENVYVVLTYVCPPSILFRKWEYLEASETNCPLGIGKNYF